MTSNALSGLAASSGQPADAAMQQRAASGRYGHHLKSMMSYQKSDSSIDAHLLAEQSCEISS